MADSMWMLAWVVVVAIGLCILCIICTINKRRERTEIQGAMSSVTFVAPVTQDTPTSAHDHGDQSFPIDSINHHEVATDALTTQPADLLPTYDSLYPDRIQEPCPSYNETVT